MSRSTAEIHVALEKLHSQMGAWVFRFPQKLRKPKSLYPDDPKTFVPRAVALKAQAEVFEALKLVAQIIGKQAGKK